MNILFVCLGNTCRSIMAEAFFKSRKTKHKCSSAGIFAYHTIVTYTKNILKKYKLPIPKAKPTQLTKDMIAKADMVICMDREISNFIHEKFRAGYGKIKVWEIADPYGMDFNAFVGVAQQVREKVDSLLNTLK